ncbi:MAG: alpha/beta hydrolase, partial [Clostridia bacterium]|nr:alpha/beta hydrolase [Clostridia bacterium]
VPYFMLGFSLGSFLLREYLARHSKGIAGAIIAGTGHQPGGLLEIIKMIVMTQIWKNGFDNTTPLVRKLSFETYNKKFAPNKTDFDWLCSDEEQLSDYLNDDGCRRAISSGLFWQLLASMKRTGDKHALFSWNKNMPVMLMSGTDDPVGDNTKGVREVFKAMEKRGFADVKIALYPKARHDIFHEVDSGIADRVAYEIRRWMEERI